MHEEKCLANIDVVILAGGLGTRISKILGNTPKILAPVGDSPFLEILLDQLQSFGARRIILCLGHLSEKIIDHLKEFPRAKLEITSVVEPKPLGTAGAVRLVSNKFASDPVMVMNGDTFVDTDFCRFVESFHRSNLEAAMLCTKVDDRSRYASIEVDDKGRVVKFLEKNVNLSGSGLVNAGVYLFSSSMVQRLAEYSGPSLELNFFSVLPAKTIQTYVPDGEFIDIGTPESLSRVSKGLK